MTGFLYSVTLFYWNLYKKDFCFIMKLRMADEEVSNVIFV